MPSPQQAPPGVNPNETKVPSLVSGFVVTWVLGLTFVILRLKARRLTENKLWWDDWLIIIALAISCAFMIDVTCYMTTQGSIGRRIWAAPPDALKVFFLGLFIAEYIYTTSTVSVKCSILAFYWRIFGTRRSTRWQIRIMFAIVSAWGIAVILVSTFQCLPVSAFWRRFNPDDDPPEAYTCGVDNLQFFIANAISNIITDVLMLLVPIPNIWRLELRRWQKIGLCFVFAVGLFVTTVSCVRLYYILMLDFPSPDPGWNFSEVMMWTGIEVNTGIVCACLPLMKPILNFAIHGARLRDSQEPTDDTERSIATIGGSGELRKRSWILQWQQSGISSWATATTSKSQQNNTSPSSALTETNGKAETYSEIDRNGLGMNQMGNTKDENEAREIAASPSPNHVTITKMDGV